MEFKIKVFNDNDNNKIELKDIFLSEKNPRFTLFDNSDQDLIDILKIRKESYDKEEVFKKLLKNEDNLDDFICLLENIKNFGWDNESERIYLVKNDDETYTVGEGNRRIAVLKLIDSELTLPFLDEFMLMQYHEDVEERKENFIYLQKLIKEFQEIFTNSIYKVHVEITNDSEYLWKIIYDKHLTGERPGMRKWKRSKHFADLLRHFPNGIKNDMSDEEFKKQLLFIHNKLRRDPKLVINDFREAQFIYSLIYFCKGYNEGENVIDFNNSNVLEEMTNLIKSSSLEKVHSFNKIRNLISEDILHIDKETFDKDYISIKYNSDNRIMIESKKIKASLLFPFIYEKWKEGEITTRDSKNQDDLRNEIELKILKGIDVSKKLTIQQLDEINEFELTPKILKQIIDLNEEYGNKYLKRFRIAHRIKTSEEDQNKVIFDFDITNSVPKKIFKILYDQFKLNINYKGKTFLNAVAITVRSFFEQFLFWAAWIVKSDNDKQPYLEEICGNCNMYHLWKKLACEYKAAPKKWIVAFEYIFHNKHDAQEKIKKFDNFLKNYLYVLNEPIHALHRAYDQEKYIENIEIIEKCVALFNEWMQMDLNAFNPLNDAIMEYKKSK